MLINIHVFDKFKFLWYEKKWWSFFFFIQFSILAILAILAIQQCWNAGWNARNAGMLECWNGMPGMLECWNAWNAGMWCRNVPKMNSGGTPYTHISLQAAIYFQYIKFGFIYKYLINIIGIMIIDEYEIIKWINFGYLEILRS